MANYQLPATSNEPPATRDQRRATINMQNKPNFPAPRMDVNKVLTKHYENLRLHTRAGTNPTCRGVASGEAGFLLWEVVRRKLLFLTVYPGNVSLGFVAESGR